MFWMLDMCFANIFFQSVLSFHSINSICSTVEVNFNKLTNFSLLDVIWCRI